MFLAGDVAGLPGDQRRVIHGLHYHGQADLAPPVGQSVQVILHGLHHHGQADLAPPAGQSVQVILMDYIITDKQTSPIQLANQYR